VEIEAPVTTASIVTVPESVVVVGERVRARPYPVTS
jgi:hypothetical protein